MSGRRQMSHSPEARNVYLPHLISLLQSKHNPELTTDPKSIDCLYHQKIGTFIAAHRCVAVVPDYRLVNMDPNLNYGFQIKWDAIWPSGTKDVALPTERVVNNLLHIVNIEMTFAMGHSAGAN
jgi:hypothetical protein